MNVNANLDNISVLL